MQKYHTRTVEGNREIEGLKGGISQGHHRVTQQEIAGRGGQVQGIEIGGGKSAGRSKAAQEGYH